MSDNAEAPHTFGFSDALILMRAGRAVRPRGWRSTIVLSESGFSFVRISETGARTAYEPSVDHILNTPWVMA